MTKMIYLLSLGLVLGVTAIAQSSGQNQTPPVNPTTPANQIGSGAQTSSGTPAPSSTTSPTGQVNPAGTAQTPATAQSPSGTTGGVAGAASSSATQNSAADTSAGGVAAMTDSDLESQIQNALSKEPTLTSDSVHATVSGDTIELAGKVSTSKEKVTATRIVQSYAGSKKVVNHLTVGGGKTSSSGAGHENRDNIPLSGTTNPASNPEPNKGNPPTASKPPLT
ncbi:MAG: BON domain-containing protein [Candidatus Angelobacter sp.]